MSTFKVEVIRLGKFGKHPNADTLSIVDVLGYPVIFRTGEFNEGDLLAYVPVDAVVPATGYFGFLTDNEDQSKVRIKAKKIRGIFSMGLLCPAPEGSNPGDDVANIMGIVKYEEAEPAFWKTGNDEKDPGFLPVYDLESWRKYKYHFKENEQVIVTEKIDGTNFRSVYKNDKLWVASHKRFKKFDSDCIFWRAAIENKLEEKLKNFPGMAIFGEVYGQVQKMTYGAKQNQIWLAVFDVYDISRGRFINWQDLCNFLKQIELSIVPVVYQGSYNEKDIKSLAEGPSLLYKEQNREGIVIRTSKEKWNNESGRTILKLVSEWYLLKKHQTATH